LQAYFPVVINLFGIQPVQRRNVQYALIGERSKVLKLVAANSLLLLLFNLCEEEAGSIEFAR
jgi:hypothetical protein